MRVVLVVQARMTSTRLPGKILRTVAGKSLLEYQVERLRRVTEADELVLATTHNEIDDQLIDCCREWELKWFRGDENDVLDRYYRAALEYNAEAVVRVTSDCPLIDPYVIDRVIRTYRVNSAKVDYVANTLDRTYPRGMDCEVFSFDALSRAFEAAVAGEREHVTRHMYAHPERFRLLGVTYDRDESRHRWTVDTPDDFELIRRLLEAVYPERPEFTLEDCLEVIDRHPEWVRINSHVQQKGVSAATPSKGEAALVTEKAPDEVSRLGLGTVQFGLDYGVANLKGRCDPAETARILEEAKRCEVRLLDTAPSYGDSEKVIGKLVGANSQVEIVSKTLPISERRITADVVDRVMGAFESTCRNLGRERLYGLLVHHAEDLLKDGADRLMGALEKLKASGRVERIGLSVYDATQIEATLDRYDLDIVQLPLNVFDQRLLRDGSLDSLKQRGAEIHARSAFLQGLLLMPRSDVPDYFSPIIPRIIEYERRLEALGMSRLQAALGFVRQVATVDKILIGVDSLEQFQANVEAFRSAPPMDYAEFAFDDDRMLDPRNWPTR